MNLSHFSLLGGTSSILRIFLGGTSEKTHPVSILCKSPEFSYPGFVILATNNTGVSISVGHCANELFVFVEYDDIFM